MRTAGFAAARPAVGTIGAMAYDEELAGRIRQLIGSDPKLTEKKMFGGLAFLIQGNMAIAASSGGGAMVRVDPASPRMLARPPGVSSLRLSPDGVGTPPRRGAGAGGPEPLPARDVGRMLGRGLVDGVTREGTSCEGGRGLRGWRYFH
jgi:hypothetical protein